MGSNHEETILACLEQRCQKRNNNGSMKMSLRFIDQQNTTWFRGKDLGSLVQGISLSIRQLGNAVCVLSLSTFGLQFFTSPKILGGRDFYGEPPL